MCLVVVLSCFLNALRHCALPFCSLQASTPLSPLGVGWRERLKKLGRIFICLWIAVFSDKPEHIVYQASIPQCVSFGCFIFEAHFYWFGGGEGEIKKEWRRWASVQQQHIRDLRNYHKNNLCCHISTSLEHSGSFRWGESNWFSGWLTLKTQGMWGEVERKPVE